MGIPAAAGGGGGEVDLLSERAAKMRDSLHKSQSITDSMVSILGSFDHRLSALETAMRPTQVRFSSLFMFNFAFSFDLGLQYVIMPILVLERKKRKRRRSLNFNEK